MHNIFASLGSALVGESVLIQFVSSPGARFTSLTLNVSVTGFLSYDVDIS